MTTTLQDVMAEEYYQEEYERELKQIGVDDYLSNNIDIGICSSILEYLPIRRNQLENDYIDHLYKSIQSLFGSTITARSFVVMPLHLLFMLSLQYKVLRIYKEHSDKYTLALTTKNPRDSEKDILAPESPLTISFLGESEIVDLLKINGLSTEDARNMKKDLVRYRNDKIAHAKGYVEQEIERKATEYIAWLDVVQGLYCKHNQELAREWLEVLETGDDIDQFIESYLLDYCFTPRDFGDIIGILLEAVQLDFEQWTQVVNKGLELNYSKTICSLKHTYDTNKNDSKNSNIRKILEENGELDSETK